MYNDDVWGRSGPHAVLNITEPVKPKRLQVVDEIKRALDIAEIVPFRYLIQHIGVVGEEYEDRKIDAAFSALEEISVFARTARRRSADRKHAQSVVQRRTPADVLRTDSSEPECLLRYRPRQHARRRRYRLPFAQEPHPLDPHS